MAAEWDELFPANGELPAQVAPYRFLEDGGEFRQLGRNWTGLRPKRGGIVPKVGEECPHCRQSIFSGKPLRRRQGLGPFGIARALFQKQSHGIFVG